jgi:hypothetical protein
LFSRILHNNTYRPELFLAIANGHRSMVSFLFCLRGKVYGGLDKETQVRKMEAGKIKPLGGNQPAPWLSLPGKRHQVKTQLKAGEPENPALRKPAG